MLIALISLSSVALLGSVFLFGEDHEDEEGSHGQDSDIDLQEIEEVGSSPDLLQSQDITGGGTVDDNLAIGRDQRPLSFPAEISLEDQSIDDALSAKPELEQCDAQLMEDVHLTNVSDGIPPLTEWANNLNLEKVDLADVDSVFIESPSQTGSLVVMQADYYERLPSDTGDITHNIHTGANIYFIPEDEEFPEEYQWSESSAGLYNSSTFIGQSNDFGGIELILRVDSGYLYGDNESDQAYEFKTRAFAEVKEQVLSNLEMSVLELQKRA